MSQESRATFHEIKKGLVMFWLDLANCHYCREIFQWYCDNGLHFIDKNRSLPKYPQLRTNEKKLVMMKLEAACKLKKTGKIGDYF